MSKVLIDRELAERVCHVDNSTRQTARRELRTLLSTPSGTPELPVKAYYYYESTTPEGVRTRSVGLEVRKTFIDAPMVLQSDALAGFAQRDARIAELEGIVDKAWNRSHQLEHGAYIPGALDAWKRPVLQNLPYDFSGNPGTPATQYCNGWNDAGGYWKAHADDLHAELAAIKAQEPVAWVGAIEDGVPLLVVEPKNWKATPLYAAPVSEAKAQGVYSADPLACTGCKQGCFRCLSTADHVEGVRAMVAEPVQQVSVPDGWKLVPVNATEAILDVLYSNGMDESDSLLQDIWSAMLDAAPAAPAADAGLVEALEKIAVYAPCSGIKDPGLTKMHMGILASDALAAHRAKGVV